MIDVLPLLRRVANEYGVDRANEVGEAWGTFEHRAYAIGEALVRDDELAPIVAAAVLTVMFVDAAMHAEEDAGPDTGRARTYRLLADLAAVDAIAVAQSWRSDQRTATNDRDPD